MAPAVYTVAHIRYERMKGWVGLVGWPVADGLPTIVVTHQLQVVRGTGKVRRPETDVLQLCNATNLTAVMTLKKSTMHRVCICDNYERKWKLVIESCSCALARLQGCQIGHKTDTFVNRLPRNLALASSCYYLGYYLKRKRPLWVAHSTYSTYTFLDHPYR